MSDPASDALALRRPLGRTGLQVCPLALGTMQFGWTVSDVDSMRIADAYVGVGGNLVDTANMYGGDQSRESYVANRAHVGVTEDILGRWMQNRGIRDEIVLTTKVRARMWDGADGEGLNRVHILRAVEDSLTRLRTDHVDVLYAHWPDPGSRAEEWLAAIGELIEAGKVRALGTSNFCGFAEFGDLLSPLLELADVSLLPRVAVEQPRYNLLNRGEYEDALQAIAVEHQLGIVTYSTLAGGFLAGTVRRDHPPTGQRAAHLRVYCTPAGWDLLDCLTDIARARQVPVASISLAWVLTQPGITAVLVGPDALSQLAQTSCAPALALDAAECDALSALSWRASAPEFVDWA